MKNINTKRLLLKTPTQEDLNAIASMWGDIEAGKYLCDPYYTSGTEIAVILEEDPDCPEHYFVARRTGFDEVMGTCSIGLENADTNEYAIGYTIKKEYWGNGYAIEMVHALIDFARESGVKSISAPVAQENRASNRVLQKCGFSIDKESSFKKSGTDVVYPSFIYKLNL